MQAVWIVDIDIIIHHRILDLKQTIGNFPERLEEILWLRDQLHKHTEEMEYSKEKK